MRSWMAVPRRVIPRPCPTPGLRSSLVDHPKELQITKAADIRFSRGLYNVAEAARLVGMSPTTFSTWAHGYERRPPGGASVRSGPVITTVPDAGDRQIPFIGLVEATVVQAFRQTGLPLQRIRRALGVLAQEGELPHALASRRLYSDGAEVLYDYARSADDKQLGLLTVVVNGQRVFHDVITDYLQRIDFDDDPWAQALIVPATERRLLRVRAEVADGEPLFIEGGAPLSAVRSRWQAGEPISAVARDYGVPERDIEDALRAIWPQTHAA
jgi:transposase-like protein